VFDGVSAACGPWSSARVTDRLRSTTGVGAILSRWSYRARIWCQSVFANVVTFSGRPRCGKLEGPPVDAKLDELSGSSWRQEDRSFGERGVEGADCDLTGDGETVEATVNRPTGRSRSM